MERTTRATTIVTALLISICFMASAESTPQAPMLVTLTATSTPQAPMLVTLTAASTPQAPTHLTPREENTPQAATQVTLAWSNIASLVIGTGFLTAILGHFMSLYSDARATKRQARSLASKLIPALESFANACSHEAAETHYDEDNEHLPNEIPVLPALRELGDNGEWASLDKQLLTSAATINNERDQALQSVKVALSLVHQEHEEDYVFKNYYEQVSSIGLRAAYLARDLRRKYGSPAGAEDSITNTIGYLEQEKANLTRSAQAGSINLD